MDIKKILVPVDGSPYSDKAVDMALKVARKSESSIVLLHVRREVPKSMITEGPAEVLRKTLNENAQELLDSYRPKLEARGLPYELVIVSGRRGHAIVEEVKKRGCDMVVMGTKGKSDIEGLLVGSVTHMVIHASPCSVLVVK